MGGLDGLRALAVIGVVLYHADVAWLPAGFLGVDIFFVVSGYLITSLLIREFDARGSISLTRFWFRRAVRLLPALFVLLAAVTGLALILLPDEVDRLWGEVVAGLAYFMNWRLIFHDTSYFEGFGRPPLLRHLWSLAIEEQFYIVWPVLFGVASRLLPRRLVLLLVLGAVAASTAWMWSLFDPFSDPSRLYFGTDTRAGTILVGAALALLWAPGRSLPKAWMARGMGVVGLGGLALLSLWMVRSSEFSAFLYQGGFLLVALTTAVVIVAAVLPGGWLGRVLAVGPLRWMGLRSYGIYLWHWPVFMLMRPSDVGLDGADLLGLRLVVVVALAGVSYRVVERPVRSGALGAWGRGLWSSRPCAPRTLALRYGVMSMGVAAAAVVTIGLVLAPTGEGVVTKVVEVVEGDVAVRAGATLDAEELRVALTAPRGVVVGEVDVEVFVGDWEALSGEVGETTLALMSRQERTLSALAGVGLLAGEGRAAMRAGLGPPAREQPLAILAIGDSVMLSVQARLEERFRPGIQVDARVSRQFTEGIALLTTRAEGDLLGETVIVHLGTNGAINNEQFEAMMEVLREVPRVIFVTVRVPRRWEPVSNRTLRAGVERWANASLVDWHAITKDSDGLFAADGVHPGRAGSDLYVRLIGALVGGFDAE